MGSLVELTGVDLVRALLAGGFRVSRRERGLALLVREQEAIVVPETETLTRAKLLTILKRAGVTEDALLTWLAMASSPAATTRSGFHRRSDAPSAAPGHTRTISELLDATKRASQRVAVADDGARAALAGSRQALDKLPADAFPDSERLRAVQTSLEEWDDAVRQRATSEERERKNGRR